MAEMLTLFADLRPDKSRVVEFPQIYVWDVWQQITKVATYERNYKLRRLPSGATGKVLRRELR